MKSLAAISSSVAGVMPAALARLTVSALRPVSEVRTLTPLSVSLRPTPAPIMPGAITATTGVILFSGSCLLFEPNPAAYSRRWQASLVRPAMPDSCVTVYPPHPEEGAGLCVFSMRKHGAAPVSKDGAAHGSRRRARG